VKEYKGDTKKLEAASQEDVVIVLDLTVDELLRQEGLAREFCNRVQKLRKKVRCKLYIPLSSF
jgi:hypothetical protein